MNLMLTLKYIKAFVAFALNHIREVTIVALTIIVIILIGLYGQSKTAIKQLKTEHALQLTTIRANHLDAQRKLEQASYDQTISAINDAKQREKALVLDAANASAVNERLSQTIDRLAANAATDAHYRIEYAATTGQLLKECSGSITKLAKAADGHVNDIRLLQQAR